MSTEQEFIAQQNRQKQSEEAKQEYQRSMAEQKLGLKIDMAPLAYDSSQIEKLDFVLKGWQKRIEDNVRVAAENYVQGALKTRKADLDAFSEQMGNFEEFIAGFREAIVSTVSQAVLQGIADIRAELEKQNAILPKQNQALDEIIRVMKEY